MWDGIVRAGFPFNYDQEEVSEETGYMPIDGKFENLTQQQFAEEVDINTIVKRFGLTGQLPENPRVPRFGDFTDITDFQTAVNAVREAEASFMALPAEVRSRFANDPQMLMEFLDDPRNREEAGKLGLLQKPPEVTRDAVTAIDELAAKITAKP